VECKKYGKKNTIERKRRSCVWNVKQEKRSYGGIRMWQHCEL